MPEIIIGDKSDPNKKAGTGTAFVLDNKGTWLTARHVIEGCKHVFVVLPPPKNRKSRYQLSDAEGNKLDVVRAEVTAVDPEADIAIINTQETRHETLKLADEEAYTDVKKQAGFGIGFPGGKPGEAAAQLIGKAISVLRLGGETVKQSSLVWSILQLNSVTGDLPGMSGGPLLNEWGEIAGVTSAGKAHKRRGRIITVAPSVLKQLLRNHVSVISRTAYRPGSAIDYDNFSNVADYLRNNHTVAQVVCFYR